MGLRDSATQCSYMHLNISECGLRLLVYVSMDALDYKVARYILDVV